MKIADNNELRNAATAAHEAGDMMTVAALSAIYAMPIEREEAEEEVEEGEE